MRHSSRGFLQTTLTAATVPVSVGGRTVNSSVYESSFPAPTLRIRPGDLLRIRLQNQLDTPTNLHLHGVHVSPSGNSDNVLVRIDPGDSFDYEYQVPANHPAGLYWYHPHLHGTTTEQVFGGMAGALIVEGELDKVAGIAGLRERLLVLQATEHDGSGTLVPPSPTRFQSLFGRLVNGQLNPTIDMQPGETQRWRIVNASASVWFRLQLSGHQLHEIATDGNALTRVRSRDEILLSPGERTEVLVQAGELGSYELRSLEWFGSASVQPDTLLATMVSAGTAVDPRPLPSNLLPSVDLRSLPIDNRREIGYMVLPRQQSSPPVPFATFEIDSKQFDMNRIDQVMRLGTTEEWVVHNLGPSWHSFHMHVNPIQVTAINGEPVEFHGYKDTVPISPNGSITFRTRFLDFTGVFVFHCHLFPHEDGGMMSLVEVIANSDQSPVALGGRPAFTCPIPRETLSKNMPPAALQ